MKQSIKVILFSCLVGGILAGTFFLNIKNKAEAKSVPTVYIFQVGVFKNYTNALNTQKNYTSSKIIKDNDLYRVFIGVTSKNKDLLKSIFDEQENYFYIKELQVSNEVKETIEKYDKLLEKASVDSRMAIIKNMIESLPDEL